MNKLAAIDDLNLTEPERAALTLWRKRGAPPLSPVASSKMFMAFLDGVSCQELARINQGVDLGCIVDARVRDGWDARRDELAGELFSSIRHKLVYTQTAAVDHLLLQMSVAHKKDGDKLRRYLITGKEEDLGDAAWSASPGNYQKVIGMLLQLTGQTAEGGGKGVKGGVASAVAAPAATTPAPTPASATTISGTPGLGVEEALAEKAIQAWLNETTHPTSSDA